MQYLKVSAKEGNLQNRVTEHLNLVPVASVNFLFTNSVQFLLTNWNSFAFGRKPDRWARETSAPVLGAYMIVPPPVVSVSPTSVSFASQQVGTTSVSPPVTLSNSGPGT
jgi:hypothetical protein